MEKSNNNNYKTTVKQIYDMQYFLKISECSLVVKTSLRIAKNIRFFMI